MKDSGTVFRTVIAGIGLALAASVSQAATIAINPIAAEAAAGDTLNFSFEGSDFSMGDGAFDLTWDSSVISYNGDFAFDGGLGQDTYFERIDTCRTGPQNSCVSPGYLAIGWTNGFNPAAIVFPESPATKTIGALSFTMLATTTPGNFSDLIMVDSAKWGSFSDEAGDPIAMDYINGKATNPVNDVPVPAAAWLFGSGLLGLAGIAKRRKQHA